MGVPFETLLPYGVMLLFFGVAGAGLGTLRHSNNGGKRQRYAIGAWDEASKVMERDQRLTGYKRGQIDRPEAPAGFELSKAWPVEKLGSPR